MPGAGLPVSLVQAAAISSSAVLRLAAANTTSPPACARAFAGGTAAVAKSRHNHSRRFMPSLRSGGRYSLLDISLRPEAIEARPAAPRCEQDDGGRRGHKDLERRPRR